jgi:RNA polymerase sigma factor (TIGR02999 family)
MTNSAGWPRKKWPAKPPGTRSSPPPSFTKRGCGWGGEDTPAFQNRAHFFGAAAEAMRRILIEHARRRLAAKRGSGVEPLDADEMEISSPVTDADQLLAVNEALEKFAAVDARKAELVKLRYFVGLNFEEAAAALGIAVPTAKQWWSYARAGLTVEMRGAIS